MEQKRAFTETEGDQYFLRNLADCSKLERRAEDDPVLSALERLGQTPRRILEIGAANGWRLEEIRQRLAPDRCVGLDPSSLAVRSGRKAYPRLELHAGTAERLPFGACEFDLVVFGFCLYLCDREDLFTIAREADRVVEVDGAIIIYDFYAEKPHTNPYHHREGLMSYKMNYAAMFAWHPAYSVVYENVFPYEGGPDRATVCILRKRTEVRGAE